MSVPSAGWYPDPSGLYAQRWWDGSAWTEQTRALSGQQGSDGSDEVSAPAGELAGGVSGGDGAAVLAEDGVSRRTRRPRGLVVLGVLVGIGVLVSGSAFLGMQLAGSDVQQAAQEEPSTAAGSSAESADDDGHEPQSDGDEAEGADSGVASGPPTLQTSRSIDPRLGEDRQLASISPDGSAVLETSTGQDAQSEVCIRDLEADEVEFCDSSIRFDTAYASWSDDGRLAVVGEGERLFVAREGGDLVLFDRDEGRARRFGDTIPRVGNESYRAMLRPALSPSGDRVAAVLWDGSPVPRLVVIDVADEQELLSVEIERGAWSVLWEPSGDGVWVSGNHPDGAVLERIDARSGEVRQLDNKVDLGVEGGHDVEGELIQINDDGRIGLLHLTELVGARGQDPLSYAAVIDLESGARAPLHPSRTPAQPADPEFYRAHSFRLSSDGQSVVFSYFDERPTYLDDAVAQPIRLARVQVDDVLAGVSEPEILIDDLSELSDTPVPQVQAATYSGLRVPRLPGDDHRLLFPLDRRSWDGPAPQLVESILEIELDRSF